jgi:Tfp pilus assembly protein PilF
MSDETSAFERALWHQQNGNPAAAEPLYQAALQADPAHADAHNNLGIIFFGKGQLDEAAACFRGALQHNPGYTNAYNNLGSVLKTQGRFAEAIQCFEHALRLQPTYRDARINLAGALNNLGNAYKDNGRLTDAIACYRQAIHCNSLLPDAHNNLGIALVEQDQLEEAVACFEEASCLNPNLADAYNNLGIARVRLGQLDEASLSFQQALQVDSGHKLAIYNRACLRLLHGDYEGGWPGYEERWARPGMVARSFVQPRWDGSPLAGKTILLYSEQGLGDTILAIRYAELIKQRGGHVVVECQPALVRLLATAAGIDVLVPQGQPLPAFDVQLPLLSLPGVFKTTLASIPNKVPYLSPEPQMVAHWRGELNSVAGFKIGIVWQGSPTQAEDRQRSVPLAQFAPLSEVPGVRLLSLQVGSGREQLHQATFPIIDLGGRFDPLSLHDLAAVLPNLDLVVTVCTSTAHLAGALGVPAWVALKFVPYWCWLLERSDSPWYPSLRLFRQRRSGDWNDVFSRIAAAIRLGGRD